MRRESGVWLVWVGLFLMLLIVCEANSQSFDAAKVVKPTEVPLTDAEQRQVLETSDAAQAAGRIYVAKQQAYLDFIKELSAKKHYPEGTTYKVDFDPAKCVPLPDGMMKCQRKIVPVFPEAKSTAPNPPAPVNQEKKP